MQNDSSGRKMQLKERSFNFSVKVFRFVDTLSRGTADQVVARQLLRSATSIGANLAEAFGSSSKKDFINYFHIALKSSVETKYWLYLLRETVKGDQEKLDSLIGECEAIANMIAASILTMKNRMKT